MTDFDGRLDAYYDRLLAQHQRKIDAEDEQEDFDCTEGDDDDFEESDLPVGNPHDNP
jgi:hypothetical protein